MSSDAVVKQCSSLPPPPPPLSGMQHTNKTQTRSQLSADSSKLLCQIQANVVETNPLQEIYYAIKKLPQWRAEEEKEEKSMWLSVNSYVSPVIQDGPTCGLVVIKLASRLLCGEESDVEYLLNEARRKKFTHQGEMFSAKNMLELATAALRCTGELVSDGLQTHRKKILTSIQRLKPVLVPYDADFNHEPCCRGGHRAHWSLLTGYLIRLPLSQIDEKQLEKLGFSPDPSCSNLFLASLPLEEDPLDVINLEAGDLYVFTRQGKSKHLGLWSFSSLVESNNNLKEFSPSRDDDEYLLPAGGVEAGLCGKAIILDTAEV